MLEWAYREFNDYRLVKAGDTVDDAPVWLGVTRQGAGDDRGGRGRDPAAHARARDMKVTARL